MDNPTALDPEACYRVLLARDSRFDGRFFTAVRTTGIYCRPICPARTPKFANCAFYPSAAAAQAAGFRPCLRCRPEASPDLGAWRGTSNTVARAMALIDDGALDGDDVEGLATRLGVGARHLRRLFQSHLGATPGAVAQTRRLLFAKQLITDTRLPLTEVALASGYGSVRRFNDAIRRVYHIPPRDLRRRQGNGEARPGPSALEIALPYSPPYDWPAMLGFLAARAIQGVEAVAAGCYRRSIRIEGIPGLVAVRPAPGGKPALLATITLPEIGALPTVVARLRRIFDLGADVATITRHLAADPRLAPHVESRPGLRVPGAWDGFELAVRAILGQQISVVAATRLAGKLVAAFGEPFDTGTPGDAVCHLFPTPARLADADVAAALGMPRARGAAISALARTAAANPGLFDRGRSLEEAIERLCRLPGIGAWTAHYIAMRALREADAFPSSDIGVLRALEVSGARPTPAQALIAAERWRPWRAYATLHLWAADAAPKPIVEDILGPVDRPDRFADRHHPAGV